MIDGPVVDIAGLIAAVAAHSFVWLAARRPRRHTDEELLVFAVGFATGLGVLLLGLGMSANGSTLMSIDGALLAAVAGTLLAGRHARHRNLWRDGDLPADNPR